MILSQSSQQRTRKRHLGLNVLSTGRVMQRSGKAPWKGEPNLGLGKACEKKKMPHLTFEVVKTRREQEFSEERRQGLGQRT